jgi:hypothetical protein
MRRGDFLEKKSAVRHPVRALESYGATSYSRWLFGNKLPTVVICFLIIKNKEALETLKGTHRMGRMGDGPNFLKTFAPNSGANLDEVCRHG